MRRIRHSVYLLALGFVFVGCSASSQTVAAGGVAKYQGATFNNILVIGVAYDYNGRSRFERNLVSTLSEHKVTAVAYYRAVGGNKPINRETIEQLVKTEGEPPREFRRLVSLSQAAMANSSNC